MKLTDSIRTHAEEKVAHAVRNYTNMVSHVEVNLSVKGHAAKVCPDAVEGCPIFLIVQPCPFHI